MRSVQEPFFSDCLFCAGRFWFAEFGFSPWQAQSQDDSCHQPASIQIPQMRLRSARRVYDAGDMDELNQLASLGLVLPSPAYLAGAILFGLIGYVAFRRGRKTSTASLTWTGVALMLYPYAVPQTWLLWAVGAGLCGWLYLKWN